VSVIRRLDGKGADYSAELRAHQNVTTAQAKLAQVKTAEEKHTLIGVFVLQYCLHTHTLHAQTWGIRVECIGIILLCALLGIRGTLVSHPVHPLLCV
jgi:hypothetical protein